MMRATETHAYPFVYKRDDRKSRILVVARQSLDAIDFAELLRRQVDEGTWHYEVIYDLRLQETPLPVEENDRLTAAVFQARHAVGMRGPVAFVVWDPPVITAAKEFAQQAGRLGLRVAVFSHIHDAEHWLDQQQPRHA